MRLDQLGRDPGLVFLRGRASAESSGRAFSDSAVLGWAAVAALTAVVGVGALGDSRPMVLLAGALALGLVAVLAPETSLALLVMVGAIKAAPWLAFLPVDSTVLAAVAVLAAMAARSYTHGIPRLAPSAALPALLGVLVLVSVLWSPAPDEGLYKALRFEGLTLLAFFAPLVVIRTRSHLERLMLAIVAMSLLTVLTAESTGDPLKPLTVAGGNDTNQIDLALSCVMGLAAVAYVGLRTSRTGRMLAAAVAIGLTLALFAAGSRGVLVGGVVAILYAGVMLGGRERWARTALAAVGLVLILVIVGPRLFGDSAARYQSVLLSGDPDVLFGRRGFIMGRGLEIAVNNPMGLGSGAYPAVTGINYPHNIELELVDEYGLLALALFLGTLACAWLWRRRAHKAGWRTESVIVGALIIVLFFDAQLSHGLNESRSLWLALGLGYALPRLRGIP